MNYENDEKFMAMNEAAIKAVNLLDEIQPLLEDYFIGNFIYDGTGITYNMPNGQKFKLSVEEVA